MLPSDMWNTYKRKDLEGETASLTQGFSKCSLLPSSTSKPWELVGNANAGPHRDL